VVGTLSYSGASALIHKDLPPYVTAAGNPISPRGINKIGLERKGFSEATILALTRAYKIFFMKKLTVKEAEKEARNSCDLSIPEVAYFVDFIVNSKNGVAR
jgi:UDP-N-acetylglucosamine acyltransferase